MLNLELTISFAKGYIPNWSEEVSVIKSQKYCVLNIMVILSEKLLGLFMKKSYKKEI